MKRFFICAIALISITTLAKAESDYAPIYNGLPKVTNEQLAKPEANAALIETAQKQLAQKQAAINDVMMRIGEKTNQARQKLEQIRQKNMPNEGQMQAAQAIGGDMMAAFAAAGITPDKMAKMSEEELMAVLLPIVAQKNGLTPQELQAMQGMSDKQAEAYMKQGNRAQRMQNSEYGSKYSQTMQGMNELYNISQEDYDKIDQIKALEEQINADNFGADQKPMYYQDRMNVFTLKEDLKTLFEKQYEPRIEALMQELNARIEKEPAWKTAGGNGIKMPAYGKDYYAKINAIVDEYNKAVVDRWDAAVMKEINPLVSDLEAKFKLYNQMENICKTLATEDARLMAAQNMNQVGISTLLIYYVNMLNTRLEAPTMGYYQMPEYVGGMG